jgi:hypothetical protein
MQHLKMTLRAGGSCGNQNPRGYGKGGARTFFRLRIVTVGNTVTVTADRNRLSAV